MPPSPLFFLLVTQMMAVHIKKGLFQSTTALDRELKLAQVIDDTIIFLYNMYEVIKAINCIISVVSGLKMNLNKSVLLPRTECDQSEVNGIPVKNTVTY